MKQISKLKPRTCTPKQSSAKVISPVRTVRQTLMTRLPDFSSGCCSPAPSAKAIAARGSHQNICRTMHGDPVRVLAGLEDVAFEDGFLSADGAGIRANQEEKKSA